MAAIRATRDEDMMREVALGNAAANSPAEPDGALRFESVVFGVRSQRWQNSVKRCIRSHPTESNSESASPCHSTTSAIRKTENCYDEGCVRGASSSLRNIRRHTG